MRLLWFLIALAVFAWLAVAPAWADVDRTPDIINSNTAFSDSSNDGVSVGGDSSKAYGFSHALGDVDINQCLGSTQWGSIIVSKQKLVLNRWCAAEVYDAKGLFDTAAKMRCSIREVRELFDSDSDCIDGNTATWVEPVESASEVDEDEDEHVEQIMAYETEINSQRQELETVLERIERLERPKPRTRTVVNQVGLTDQQRNELAKVFEK